MKGHGSFHVHEGVDIAAPDGTPVYPVRSGTARLRSKETVIVDSSDGRTFHYWHIVPTIRDGQQVTAYRTVLGHVRKGYEHVHLTEFTGGRPANPLAPGHLTPYRDRTRPAVRAVTFRPAGSNATILPEFLRGRVTVVADAYDTPAKRVFGDWRGLPVAPALVTWRLAELGTGKAVVREQVGFDARERMPTGPFWSVYARGTRQNMTGVGRGRRAWFHPGVYLLRVGELDTTRLADGTYELVVTARDTRGNRGSLRQIVSVRNDRRWLR